MFHHWVNFNDPNDPKMIGSEYPGVAHLHVAALCHGAMAQIDIDQHSTYFQPYIYIYHLI